LLREKLERAIVLKVSLIEGDAFNDEVAVENAKDERRVPCACDQLTQRLAGLNEMCVVRLTRVSFHQQRKRPGRAETSSRVDDCNGGFVRCLARESTARRWPHGVIARFRWGAMRLLLNITK
jgi:hypothetical protein